MLCSCTALLLVLLKKIQLFCKGRWYQTTGATTGDEMLLTVAFLLAVIPTIKTGSWTMLLITLLHGCLLYSFICFRFVFRGEKKKIIDNLKKPGKFVICQKMWISAWSKKRLGRRKRCSSETWGTVNSFVSDRHSSTAKCPKDQSCYQQHVSFNDTYCQVVSQ